MQLSKILLQILDSKLKQNTAFRQNYGFLTPKSHQTNDVYCTLLQQDAVGLGDYPQFQLE